jgi:hypothetical protein
MNSMRKTMGKVGQSMNLQNHECDCKREMESSLSMEQEGHDHVNIHQQQIMGIVDYHAIDLPTAKTPRIEPIQCIESLTIPYLERDMK